MSRLILLTILLSLACGLAAQKQIDYQSDWGERKPSFPNQLILCRNVIFHHDDMTMNCDSAVFHTEDNFIEAFGEIHLYQDTTHLYGDRVYYDGNTKTAEIFGETVILQEGGTTLETDYMVWDRVAETIRYTNSAEIWDEKSTLRSLIGTYYTGKKRFEFTDKVQITSPRANIDSDSLAYDTRTDVAYFYSATRIFTSDSVLILTNCGNYNTKTDQSELYLNSRIRHNAEYLTADTIYYNTQTQCGKAFGNIFIEDTANKVQAYGRYLETDRTAGLKYAFLTGQALFKQIDKDTLYLHADTLRTDFDSTDKAERMSAFKHVKVYKNDMQAACEYLDYYVKDSVAYMTERPVLWQDESQFTADTIRFLTQGKGIKQMQLYPNPMIIQNSDTATAEYFNQISGKYLMADFKENKISYSQIDGNINIVYHVWEEKKDRPKQHTGINIGTCASLKMYFEKGKLKKMTAVQNPDFYIDDMERIDEKDKTLKGFIWSDDIRPRNSQDIFLHRD